MRFLHSILAVAAAALMAACGNDSEPEGDDDADVVVQDDSTLTPASGYVIESSVGCPGMYPYRKFVLGRWRCYATP